MAAWVVSVGGGAVLGAARGRLASDAPAGLSAACSGRGQAGVESDLDECGGHAHAGWPYHYHPSVEPGMSAISPSYSGRNFTAYWVAPK